MGRFESSMLLQSHKHSFSFLFMSVSPYEARISFHGFSTAAYVRVGVSVYPVNQESLGKGARPFDQFVHIWCTRASWLEGALGSASLRLVGDKKIVPTVVAVWGFFFLMCLCT